jgi:sulfatase maturation enzyme AslB (radical SAM superfamily)
MKNDNYVSMDLPISSICGLDCNYCYIPKNNLLKKIHKKWKEVYLTGESFELISERFIKNNFISLSLWGAEPSMGFKDLYKLEEFLDYNPKLKEFSTSTNFTNFNGVESLLKKLDNYYKNKNIIANLRLQISIDGPEHITDNNRGKNVYKTIIKNLDRLNDLLPSITNVKVSTRTKLTCTTDNFKYFMKNRKELQNFICLMNKIENKMKSNSNFHDVSLITLPTLGLPGSYTSEDGKVFAKFLEFEDEVLKDIGGNLINIVSMYEGRIYKIFDHLNTLYFRRTNDSLQCSAGVAMQGMDMDGTKHGCHGSYWYNYDEYEENIYNLEDWSEGRRIMGIDKSSIKNHIEQTTANYRDDYNIARVTYLLRSQAVHVSHKISVGQATLFALAKAGQVSKVYLEEGWSKLLSSYIYMTSNCFSSSSIETGNVDTVPLSIYRIYGNGAFEYLLKRIEKNHGRILSEIK